MNVTSQVKDSPLLQEIKSIIIIIIKLLVWERLGVSTEWKFESKIMITNWGFWKHSRIIW